MKTYTPSCSKDCYSLHQDQWNVTGVESLRPKRKSWSAVYSNYTEKNIHYKRNYFSSTTIVTQNYKQLNTIPKGASSPSKMKLKNAFSKLSFCNSNDVTIWCSISRSTRSHRNFKLGINLSKIANIKNAKRFRACLIKNVHINPQHSMRKPITVNYWIEVQKSNQYKNFIEKQTNKKTKMRGKLSEERAQWQ